MAWTEGNPINFSVDGDTTAEAIAKIIQEFESIYGFMNRLRDLDTGPVAPSDPETNALWVDTSADDTVLRSYSGSTWNAFLTMASLSDWATALASINDSIDLKANIASPTISDPTFTGTTTAPTPTAGDNTTKISTTAFVKTAIDNDTIDHADYATSTVGGTVKMRVLSGVLYVRSDGTNA